MEQGTREVGGTRSKRAALIALMVGGLAACGETGFQSSAPKDADKPDKPSTAGSNSTPNSEVDKVLSPNGDDLPQNCATSARAVRIAFIVDNTGSNCSSDCQVQTGNSLVGSDPPRVNAALFGGKPFTQRQRVVSEAIQRIVTVDEQARAQKSDFIGTDVGLASFPKPKPGTNTGLNEPVTYEGSPALPVLMNNSASLKAIPGFNDSLWDLLKFTHKPLGHTPYQVALQAASKVLPHGRKAGDTRQEYVFFITDGLPTDERPSVVREARKALGDKVKVIMFSVYMPGLNTESQNANAKATLSDGWNNPQILWGRKAGNNDGFASFDAYWKALLELPKEIADVNVDVNGAENLAGEVDKVLDLISKCGGG